jgi:glutathione S-transferase
MSLVLYYGSGSPYAWRAQLALERKALPYERKVLSFSAGDTRKPEFAALNPRCKVPVLVDGDFVLYESNAIVEYLDEAYPATGARLFPGDAKARALVRRVVLEVDNYFGAASEPLVLQAFFVKPEARDPAAIAKGMAGVAEELQAFAKGMRGDYLAGPLSAADFAFYPMLAITRRCRMRLPEADVDALIPAPIAAWMKRIEALPYFDTTVPPHWKQG